MDASTVVTGGAGFIGSHLVERLVGQGRRVRVLERPGADCSHLPESVEVVSADIRDRGAVRSAMIGARHVFHLAANPNLWVRDRSEFEAVNHQGTIHVLDEAIAAGAERILHTSTESILTCAGPPGPSRRMWRLAEADAVGPYCLSKLRAEMAAMERARAGTSGPGGQSHHAGWSGRSGAVASDPVDPRLRTGPITGADGLHAEPD